MYIILSVHKFGADFFFFFDRYILFSPLTSGNSSDNDCLAAKSIKIVFFKAFKF